MRRILIRAALILGSLAAVAAITVGAISYVQWESVHCHETGGYHIVLMPVFNGQTTMLIPMTEPDEVCH